MPTDLSVLTDARYFLTGFDGNKRELQFVKTTAEALRQLPFHDGRVPFSDDTDSITISLAAALEWQKGRIGHPELRLVVHTSFCASTLLARLLDADDQVFTYREPQVLIDLANLHAAKHAMATDSEVWPQLCIFVLGQLNKSWNNAQEIVIKPSNWANNAVPELLKHCANARVVLLSSTLEDYLVANLRGGRPRLGYTLNLLNHLNLCFPEYHAIVLDTETPDINPLQRVLRQVAIAFHLQRQQLRTIESALPDRTLRLAKLQVTEAPIETLSHAKQALDLGVLSDLSKASIVELTRHNQKSASDRPFRIEDELTANRLMQRDHGSEIQATLAWYAATLATRDPQQPLVSNQ